METGLYFSGSFKLRGEVVMEWIDFLLKEYPFWAVVIIAFLCFLPIAVFVWYFRDLFYEHTPMVIKRNHKIDPELLISFIQRAKRHIYIVAGEMHPRVYTREVFEALEMAYQRGLQIFIIAGPVFLSRDQALEIKLFEMIRNETIHFFISSARQRHHFFVDGQEELFFEEAHGFTDSTRTTVIWKANGFEARGYQKKFRKLIVSNKVTPISGKNLVMVIEENQLEIFDKKKFKSSKTIEEYSLEDYAAFMNQEGIIYSIRSIT